MFCFWIFWIFCSFERFFFKALPEPGFFLEWGHFCLFLAFEEGGGGSPRTFGFFGFFGIPAVLGLFLWNEIFVFGFFGFSAVSSVFFCSKPYQNQGFFLAWGHFVVFGIRGGGGVVSPRTLGVFGFFGIPAVLGPFFWNEIFAFGFFGFSAVSSVFFQNLTRTRVFFWNSAFFRPMHLTRICLVIPRQLAVVLSSQILLLLSVLSSVN